MKRIIWILSIILISILLSGCISRNLIDAEKFQRVMEDSGYEIVEATYQVDSDYLTKLLITITDGAYQFEFNEFISISSAQRYFGAMQSFVERGIGSSHVTRSLSGTNFSSYEMTTNGRYYHLLRVDNVLISADGNEEYRDHIREMFRVLDEE